MNFNNDSNPTLQSINYLIQSCHESKSFKTKFLKAPVEVIKELDPNFDLNKDRKLVVEDQSNENIVYINIPRKPDLDELELTDEQLEAVSGGFTILILAYAIYKHEGDIKINIQIGNDNKNDMT